MRPNELLTLMALEKRRKPVRLMSRNLPCRRVLFFYKITWNRARNESPDFLQ